MSAGFCFERGSRPRKNKCIFIILGETIGEENPDIRGDMQESCRESRSISAALEKLCESMSHSVMGNKSGSSPKGMPLLGKGF